MATETTFFNSINPDTIQQEHTPTIDIKTINQMHARLLEVKAIISSLETEEKELKEDILQFFSENPLKSIKTDYGTLSTKRAKRVSVGDKQQLVSELLSTEFAHLITINHTSFPKVFEENQDFFEKYTESCAISVEEYTTLSVRK